MPDADGDERLTAHVGEVLRWIWDPIDLGARGPEDEYDAYVPDLVALARDTAVFECALVAHLARIEVEAMQLTLSPAKRTRTARALLGLRQAHLGRIDRLVAQWTSPDGLRCAWVFKTPGGQYAYEDGVLRHEDDENGSWSWWDGTGLGRSGLYETAEAAARDAHAVIGWLRAGDLGASASMAVPWREAIAWRALDPRERAVLDRLLAADFPGRDELAAQARTALVRRIDDAGSLRFRVEGAPPPRSSSMSRRRAATGRAKIRPGRGSTCCCTSSRGGCTRWRCSRRTACRFGLARSRCHRTGSRCGRIDSRRAARGGLSPRRRRCPGSAGGHAPPASP